MNKKTNRLHSSQKNAMLRARNREQVRSYFEQVLNLRNSGKPFPVDLDDVWPLVYSRKDNAVKVLTDKFIQDKEFVAQLPDSHRFRQKAEKDNVMQLPDSQSFRQKAEKSNTMQLIDPQRKVGGDFSTKKYYLSVDCMQYLIAREDRAIFDIYQQVFYLAMDANTPIADVYPLLYQGKIYYPYQQLLKAIGFSGRSGAVQKRKRQYPQHFIKMLGHNLVTPELADILVKQRELFVLQENMRHAQGILQFKDEEA